VRCIWIRGWAARQFARAYGAKFAKAVAKIIDDLNMLLEFYNFLAEHWVHLRTTNPIESAFPTVRHRTKVTKRPRFPRRRPGHGAQADRGRAGPVARGELPQLVALVRAEATFTDGKLVERPTAEGETQVV
jgi:putative transposase